MHQSSSTESASPGGRRLSRSFHSCLRGADNDDQESGINFYIQFSAISKIKRKRKRKIILFFIQMKNLLLIKINICLRAIYLK